MNNSWNKRLLKLLIILGELICKPKPHPCPVPDIWIEVRFGGTIIRYKGEIEMGYHVTNDHQDEPFSVSPVTGAQDAEGEPIGPEEFTQTDVVSDNETSVSIVDDPQNPGGKALHFGSSGTAHVSTDTLYRGEVVKHTEATITVTTGAIDPSTIQGGELTIPGLTPDPEAPTPA